MVRAVFLPRALLFSSSLLLLFASSLPEDEEIWITIRFDFFFFNGGLIRIPDASEKEKKEREKERKREREREREGFFLIDEKHAKGTGALAAAAAVPALGSPFTHTTRTERRN